MPTFGFSSPSRWILGAASFTLFLVWLGGMTIETTTAATSSVSQQDGEADNNAVDNQQKKLEEKVCDTETTRDAPENDTPQQEAATQPVSSVAHPEDSSLQLFHFVQTTSTQDETKRIILEQLDDLPKTTKTICVTTLEQSNGRGTSGRQWMAQKGNAIVTIAIPQAQWWKERKIPLTLLPLKIGSLVAQEIQTLHDNLKCNKKDNDMMIHVKWPNDVLVNHEKIAGVLIESASDWFLIGIGINLAFAPSVPTDGPNHGRQATSLSHHCHQDDTTSTNQDTTIDWEDQAQQLGVSLAWKLHQFLYTSPKSYSQDDATNILNEWKSWIDWDMELVMRDTPNRERVKMTNVLPDGRVQVIGQDDGLERTLVSDYFF